MRRIYLLSSALFVAMVFWVSSALAEPVLHMDVAGYPPGTTEITVNVGDYITFNLYLTDVPKIGPGEHDYDYGLIAWYHDILLDPLVDEVQATWNPIWEGGYKRLLPPTAPHTELELNAYHMTRGYWGEVPLAEITMHCAGFGETIITQAWHFAEGFNFMLADGSDFTPILEPPSIHINQVPIPTTLLLLGSGIIGIIGLRRKIQG